MEAAERGEVDRGSVAVIDLGSELVYLLGREEMLFLVLSVLWHRDLGERRTPDEAVIDGLSEYLGGRERDALHG